MLISLCKSNNIDQVFEAVDRSPALYETLYSLTDTVLLLPTQHHCSYIHLYYCNGSKLA